MTARFDFDDFDRRISIVIGDPDYPVAQERHTADQNMTWLLRNELNSGRITEEEFHEAWEAWTSHGPPRAVGDIAVGQVIGPCFPETLEDL